MIKLSPYNTTSLLIPSIKCPTTLIPAIEKELVWVWENIPCAGMAAPQFGRQYRCFVAQGQLFMQVDTIEVLGVPSKRTEGCFSCAGWHTIDRYPEVNVKIGKEVTRYTGYIAQVIQHEYDHLEGILINKGKGA